MKKYVVSNIWWTSTCSIFILFKYLVPSLHRCQRLGLTSLAYLWRRDQEELLKEMIDSQLTAVLIKVASLGKKISIFIMQLHFWMVISIIKYPLHILWFHELYSWFTQIHVPGMLFLGNVNLFFSSPLFNIYLFFSKYYKYTQ